MDAIDNWLDTQGLENSASSPALLVYKGPSKMPPVFAYQSIAFVTCRRIDNVALKRSAAFTVE
jgi:hypothetical protein